MRLVFLFWAFGLCSKLVINGDGGCSYLAAYRRANGSSQVHWLGRKVGSHLAPQIQWFSSDIARSINLLTYFCIHRVNRVNSRNDSES